MSKAYPNDLRVVYKHLVVHPQITHWHEAACAAHQQQKYMAFEHLGWEKAYTNRGAYGSKEQIEALAAEAGISNMDKFRADRDGMCVELVKSDKMDMMRFGINGTPGFYVNGRYVLSRSPDAFKKLIDEELQKANAAIAAGKATAADYYEKIIVGTGDKQLKTIEM